MSTIGDLNSMNKTKCSPEGLPIARSLLLDAIERSKTVSWDRLWMDFAADSGQHVARVLANGLEPFRS